MAEIIKEDKPIASYPYQDIEDNSGVVAYYCYNAKDTNGTTYRISKEIIGSSMTVITTNDAAAHSFDFDSPLFNTPKVINGTVVCYGMWYHGDRGTPQFKLYHFNGVSTYTQIGSTWQAQGFSATATETLVPLFSITNQKFKKGEGFRLNISYITEPARATEFGCDPLNRDGTQLTPSTVGSETTIFKILIPFRIN
jgi:hypothetical protein